MSDPLRIESQELLEEFYSIIKEQYPDLNFEQVKEICFSPWLFVKEVMESGSLEGIRLKYFGTFQVYPGRAKAMLKRNEEKFNKGHIKEKRYLQIKEMITNYLNKIENEED